MPASCVYRAMKIGAALLVVVVVLATSCKPQSKATVGAGPYLGALAQAQAEPLKSKPITTTPSTDAIVYTFAPPSGLASVKVTVAKTKVEARRVDVTASPGQQFALGNFGTTNPTSTGLPSEWFDLGDGPLKGLVLHLPGYIGSLGTPGKPPPNAELFTPNYFLSKAYAFENKELMEWACSSGRAGVKGGITVSTFLERCDEAFAGKGRKESFTGIMSRVPVLVSGECDLAVVTSDNGRPIACNYTARTGKIEAR